MQSGAGATNRLPRWRACHSPLVVSPHATTAGPHGDRPGLITSIVQGQQVAVTRDVPGVRDNLRDNELSARGAAPLYCHYGGESQPYERYARAVRIAFTVMLVTDQSSVPAAVRILHAAGS